MKPTIRRKQDKNGVYFICIDEYAACGIGDTAEEAFEDYRLDVNLEIMEAEREAWSINF